MSELNKIQDEIKEIDELIANEEQDTGTARQLQIRNKIELLKLKLEFQVKIS